MQFVPPVGSYRIVRPIGRGGMGMVYEAKHTLIGKRVGDEVKVRMPGGERTYEVLDITFSG